MSMIDWAERECRIACKKENPNFNFDSDDFDYGCSCYKSALKAYKSLCEDEHSGASWGFTKNILIRLMESQPLTPITDEDFFSVKRGTEEYSLESDEYLKAQGLKSEIQCPRMSSLFRTEALDGKVSYHDVDRAYFINIENPSDTYSSDDSFLDKIFPITMPYIPKKGRYRIYAQTFLTDKKHGDFDTKGIMYVITPEGEKVELNIFRTEGDDGNWKDITKEEYDDLLSRRIDRLSIRVADNLLWTLISNSSNDEEIKRREEMYHSVSEIKKQEIYESLCKLCLFFENPDNYRYNTFHIHQALCKGNEEVYKDVPELVETGRFLQKTLANIMNIEAYDIK